MANSIFKNLTEEQKDIIIEYYLFPHSASDTINHFNIYFNTLTEILAERGIQKHSKDTITMLRLSKTATCAICGKNICVSSFSRHLLAHKRNSPILKPNRYHVTHDGLNCIYCNKLCKNKNSLAQHECRCKSNPNRKCYDNLQAAWENPWNKGLNAKTDIRVANNRDSRKKYFETHAGSFAGKHHSDETKMKMSDYAKTHDTYLNFHGSRKSFEYNGHKFMSSYEVIVAKCLDSNNINWEQPNKLSYIDNVGKIHAYIADFYLPDYDVYLDPKNNYLIDNINPVLGYKDVDKINWVMEQNNVRIIILNKDELNYDAIMNKILE